MKRFSWPLQRLLDLAVQKEQTLQGQVLKLAREIRSLREEVRQIRSQIAERLRELAQQPLMERLARREIFLRWSVSRESEIASTLGQITALQERRKSLLEEFHRARAARKTLERLREESLLRYKKQCLRTEQGRLDEAAQGAHARRSMGILPMSDSEQQRQQQKDRAGMAQKHTGRMPVPQVTQ